MNKDKSNQQANTDMEAEPEEFTVPKRRTRKRKEEVSDTSDSETIKRHTRTKRKAVISSNEDEEEIESQETSGLLDTAKRMLTCLNGIREYEDLKVAKKLATRLCTLALAAEQENATLKKKINSTRKMDEKIESMEATLYSVVKTMKELSKAQKPQMQTTYAEKLKANAVANVEAAKNIKRHVITVFPGENSKIADSDETKRAIISSVAPTKDKLRIVNLRKISNKGVLIETKTEEDLKTVLGNSKLKAAGLMAGLPAKVNPRILIKNLPKDLQEKEISAAVRHQNLDNYPKDKLQDHFKLSFKTGPRDRETVDWVAEVSPEAREKILKEGRLYVGWHACYVQDFVAVTRCYQCQAFGHIAKHCKATTETCGHCTDNGHSQKNCPNSKKEPQCVNCKRAGKAHNHSSRSKDCPAYQSAMRTYVSRIDYGQK